VEWLLYSKTTTGEWAPVFGPLSAFAGGALVYAAVLLAPAYLTWHTVRKARREGSHNAGWGWVVAWATGLWPLFLIWGLPHIHARGSPKHQVALVVAMSLSVLYLIVGLWKVLPFVVKGSTGRTRKG